MKLIKFKNLNKESSQVDEDFNKWSNLINLDNKWTFENAINIEIKKSILRSKIRYSINADNLQTKIIQNIRSLTKDNCKITRLYPMIHLPKDKLEAGGFHFDQVDDKEIKTVWIAASEYRYPALSIFDANFKSKKINDILVKLKIPNLFSKKIYVEQGDINVWDGKLIHAGNFNSSKKVSLALQMKIISPNNDFIFEETKNISNISSSCFIGSNYTDKDIINLNTEYNNIIKEIFKRSESGSEISKDLSILKDFLKKINIQNFKHYSFAISILSQRLRSFKNIFSGKIKNIKKFVILLDYLSLILGAENLISVKRLFIDSKRNKNFLNPVKNYIDNSDKKFEKFNKILELF